ncbi:MAG: succinylglutamate desuccinylase/aspartoacylase family protein [Acidobacteriota bacterium]|nr:succinylglutamate desuccinylase/aspartoacylase family protein [Acidobacteriota bacterium]
MAKPATPWASEPIRIGESTVAPGSFARLELPLARLFTGTWLKLPVAVIHGATPGPRVWLDAAIHGDELNGVEIINQVLDHLDPGTLRGAVLAVPVVNVFGFVQQDRYLPDRRDLNRSFPGSPRGSLASRLAHLFMTQVVNQCHYGIDLHTGSQHRTNLPQIRGNLENPEVRRLAEAFGAPLIYDAGSLRGSLRAAARKQKIPMVVYEAGEPMRFDDDSIAVGVRGVLRVLTELDLWPEGEHSKTVSPALETAKTRWIRASQSGIAYLDVKLGERVQKNQTLGHISDPLSPTRRLIRAPAAGMVIGFTNNPLVHQGDALLHLAMTE